MTTDDARKLAEIEARVLRKSGATIFDAEGRHQAVALREDDFAFLIAALRASEAREARLRGALEHASMVGEVAMPYKGWKPTLEWAMDQISGVQKIIRAALKDTQP